MEPEENAYEIHGVVTGREGRPIENARVTAWWQHIRERRELAAGTTSDDGRYHLRYRIPEDAARSVLIVVEAVSDRLDAPLSSPLTQAARRLEIDLHFEPKDQSEWATLVRSIEPFLNGLTLAALVENSTHQDISFLAREINKDTETVMRVAVSARLAATFNVPAPAFYAFLRQHVPAGLPSPLLDASQNFTLIDPLIQRIGSLIFALSTDAQTTTLTSAIALDLIGPQYTSQVSRWVGELQALRSTDLLSQPYLVGKTTLGQLLDVVALPEAKQQAFAQALATGTQSMRNFWRTLGDGTHGFTAEEASAVERTLSVGAFVKNFVPLIQVLVQRFGAGTYTSLADLARLTRQDWVQLVNENGTPPGIEAAGTASPAEVFAAVVYTRVTRAYPTAALSSRIVGGTFVPQPHQQPLIQFFQNNAALELIKDSLPAYLAANEGAFAGIDAADQPTVVAHARTFQRVLRVAPNVDVAENLLGQGIKSAAQIAALGQQQFFIAATGAGLTKREANHVYQVAAKRYAQLVSLYLRFNTDSVGIWPNAMGQLSDLNGLAQQAIERDQSLATLFGSQDYCATDDCTSILSPAAYLCDLLLWLRNHQQVGYTALDVLDSRRPDIRHLLLNCPNTDTELPYIDLVNELLADKISPPVDALATSFSQEALTDGTTYYYIVTAVNAMGESAASAQVSATPAAPTAVPAAPTGVTAVAGDGQATLSWTAVPGATSYNIYWSTTSGVTTANGTQIPGAPSPYVQTGLTDGTTYYYIVTAVNAMGESAASAQVSATPAAPTAVPAAPTGVTAVAGDGQATLSWTAVPGATSYNIYWSTTSGVTTANGTQIPGAPSPYVQTGLTDGTTYYYIVTAVNAMGESAASAQVSATPAAPTAVPAAPTGVTAVAGDGQATLSWTAVPGATSYNIYWSTTSGVTTTNGTQITGARNPTWKQTSANKTAAELAAAPEYFNQGAFNALSAANYPFSLPYSAGLDALTNLPATAETAALAAPAGAGAPERRDGGAKRRRGGRAVRHPAARGRPDHDRTGGSRLRAGARGMEHAQPGQRPRSGRRLYRSRVDHLRATARASRRGMGPRQRRHRPPGRQRSVHDQPGVARARAARRGFPRPGAPLSPAVAQHRRQDVGTGPAPAVRGGGGRHAGRRRTGGSVRLQAASGPDRAGRGQPAGLLPGHRHRNAPRSRWHDDRLPLRADLPEPDGHLRRARPGPGRPALRRDHRGHEPERPPACHPGGARRLGRRRGHAVRPHRQSAHPGQPRPHLPGQGTGGGRAADDSRSHRPRAAPQSRPRTRRPHAAVRLTRGHAHVLVAGQRRTAAQPEHGRGHVPPHAADRDDPGLAHGRRRYHHHRRQRRWFPVAGLLHRDRLGDPSGDGGRRGRQHDLDGGPRPAGHHPGRRGGRHARRPRRWLGHRHADDPGGHHRDPHRRPAGRPEPAHHADRAHHRRPDVHHRREHRAVPPAQLLRLDRHRDPPGDSHLRRQ